MQISTVSKKTIYRSIPRVLNKTSWGGGDKRQQYSGSNDLVNFMLKMFQNFYFKTGLN